MEQLLLNPQLLLFAALRPLGMFVIFPMLGARSLGSSMVRNALIIMVMLPMLPLYLAENSPLLPKEGIVTAAFVLQEITIGAIIGFVAALPFWALDSAGFFIDTVRGASMSTVLNPGLGDAASVLGIFFVQIFITLFMIKGGLNQMLEALYQSYRILPPATPLVFSRRWLTLLHQQWNLMFELSIGFALPSLVIMILTDMALGLLNRSAQQLNVFFLAMPIKSVMVLLMLIVGIGFALADYFGDMSSLSSRILPLLSGMRG